MTGFGKRKMWIVHTVLAITIILGFVFASGCFDGWSRNMNSEEVTKSSLPPGVIMFCTQPACPYYCPLENHGCVGGCGLVCADREIKSQPNEIPLKSVKTYENLKIGDTANITFYGYKLALAVTSFKEYNPEKKLSYHEGCGQAIWYRLQLKIKNLGDEEVRGFHLLVKNEPALVDSGGGEISPYYCYPETMDSGSSADHSPPEYLLPGDTRYWNFTYVFTDNSRFQLPAYSNISRGAVFHFKNRRCLDEKYDANYCPSDKKIVDDVSWIVFPSGSVQQLTPSPKTVTLDLTIDEWGGSGFPQNEVHKIKSSILDVREGEEFGPADYSTAYKKTRPFKVLTIIDEDHIKIQFDDYLVVAGEPVSNPSELNPIIVSHEKVCFRTRTSDSGTDFCLKIVK